MVGPNDVITNHRIEHGDHLAHDRNDHDLRHLASALEALAEGLEHRIPIARAHRCHVQRLTDRPGGNATGTNSFSVEVLAKRLALLHELVPKAMRVAVLINPNTPTTELILREVQEAARTIGLQIRVLNASTIDDIDAAFSALPREHTDALLVAGDALFTSRRVQIVTLAARDRIPSAYSLRDHVVAGGLMSYGTDIADRFRQTGVYTGAILKGAKPADLPVLQPTKLEFVINLQTAKLLGIEVPETLLATADELIK
jgi:putative ABC transport system substrate-binding protein